MGWESRDWGQWTDEERETYLDGRERRQPLTAAQLLERLDSPYSSGISARVKIWGGLQPELSASPAGRSFAPSASVTRTDAGPA
jgi:hypothetical protein